MKSTSIDNKLAVVGAAVVVVVVAGFVVVVAVVLVVSPLPGLVPPFPPENVIID